MAKVVRVIISNVIKKIDRPYDYLCSFDGNLVGRRVVVPFGKANTPKKALVVAMLDDQPDQPLKQVIDILDTESVIEADQVALIDFL